MGAAWQSLSSVGHCSVAQTLVSASVYHFLATGSTHIKEWNPSIYTYLDHSILYYNGFEDWLTNKALTATEITLQPISSQL